MDSHLSNVVLNALPAQLNGFRAKLTAVALPIGTSLYEPYETPRFAHFLTSGLASVVTSMKDGGSVETGLWTRDGLAECMHIAGSDRVPTRCFMQIAGTALRMPFADLLREFETVESLRASILQSIQNQALILSQLVACNRLHEVEERL
ncbi:MAG TPA: Crp/Fnr family transcriptional regulator, partial [Acidobacteriaceae bacterium]